MSPRLAKTKARGYGAEHKRLRKRWQLEVDAGLVACARCGRWIAPGSLWDLGHVDGSRTEYAGPEHRRCNRATRRGRWASCARRASAWKQQRAALEGLRIEVPAGGDAGHDFVL